MIFTNLKENILQKFNYSIFSNLQEIIKVKTIHKIIFEVKLKLKLIKKSSIVFGECVNISLWNNNKNYRYFGYESIFKPKGFDQTFGEIDQQIQVRKSIIL